MSSLVVNNLLIVVRMVVQVHPGDQVSSESQEEVETVDVGLLTTDQKRVYKRDSTKEDWPLKFTTPDASGRDTGDKNNAEFNREQLGAANHRQEHNLTIEKVNPTMIDRHNIHRVFGHKIWFVTDVCGIICASFTYWLLLFAQYVVLTCILLPEESFLYKGECKSRSNHDLDHDHVFCSHQFVHFRVTYIPGDIFSHEDNVYRSRSGSKRDSDEGSHRVTGIVGGTSSIQVSEVLQH